MINNPWQLKMPNLIYYQKYFYVKSSNSSINIAKLMGSRKFIGFKEPLKPILTAPPSPCRTRARTFTLLSLHQSWDPLQLLRSPYIFFATYWWNSILPPSVFTMLSEQKWWIQISCMYNKYYWSTCSINSHSNRV